jgi:hypothetical protein
VELWDLTKYKNICHKCKNEFDVFVDVKELYLNAIQKKVGSPKGLCYSCRNPRKLQRQNEKKWQRAFKNAMKEKAGAGRRIILNELFLKKRKFLRYGIH